MSESTAIERSGGLEPDDWQEVLAQGDLRIRSVIQEHPVATVIGAALLGFLIARLVRDDG